MPGLVEIRSGIRPSQQRPTCWDTSGPCGPACTGTRHERMVVVEGCFGQLRPVQLSLLRWCRGGVLSGKVGACESIGVAGRPLN